MAATQSHCSAPLHPLPARINDSLVTPRCHPPLGLLSSTYQMTR